MTTAQVVLMTGASRGFGAVGAREIAERGHHVVATMRRPDRDGAAVIDGYEARIDAVPCDVQDVASVEAAVAFAVERHGRIDVLVNNAGQSMIGAIEELTNAEIATVLDVNLLGPLRLIRAVLPHMRRQGRGKIVNVSSQAGRMGGPIVGGYCASKFALEGLSEALRFEVGPLGIQVVIVQPGIVKTDHLSSNMVISQAIREGRSVYQGAGDAVIAALQAAGRRRQGPRTVACAIADLVEIEEPLPLRVLVGDDTVRNLTQRAAMTDDEWEASRRALPADGYPGAFFHAATEATAR